MARRSPAEKKALSDAKDRRNTFGENDKSSRRNIRRNKRVPNRADRHREHQVLHAATGISVVDEVVERAETALLAKRSTVTPRTGRPGLFPDQIAPVYGTPENATNVSDPVM